MTKSDSVPGSGVMKIGARHWTFVKVFSTV